tara:strand:- start:20565 stop:21359 length:795 start_codon:yes stop_codon:yes gene_type:complete
MNTYGLVRVSTLSQKDNTSLEFQTKRIKDYCSVYDLPLKGIISETESGGKNVDERTGLLELKELIKSDECKTIVVTKVDRLGRSLLQGLLFLKECEEHNVRVICIENGIDTDNPQSKLITNILFSIAENEKSTILGRLSDGRLKRFEENKKPYGALSFGYVKNNKGEIVINKIESDIVQYIYKRYNTLRKMKHLTKTKRTQKLLKSLKVRGYKFRGKEFKWWNIKDILSNPFYCGVLNWKEQSTKHAYDTIVSKRMFNQINLTN